uniref:RNA1 polyprotein n=1 Tax=Canberra spider orchid nepovirus TaxID=3115759 RepID=A0AAT9JAQ0_9SECO
MAHFQIGSVTLAPRFHVVERRLTRALLSKPASFALSFLAQGASLKPTMVALAAINGIISADTENFGILAANGETLTWGDAARVVRRFMSAHAKVVKPKYVRFRKECERRCNAFNAKKAARKAAGIASSCKRILASLDADAPTTGRQRRAICKASRAAFEAAEKKAAFFRQLRAAKKAERAWRAEWEPYVAPFVAPSSVPYVCPLGRACTERMAFVPSVLNRGRTLVRLPREEDSSPSIPSRYLEGNLKKIYSFYKDCTNVRFLDIHTDIKIFFLHVAERENDSARLCLVARLARAVCAYAKRFPLSSYFDSLKILKNDSSRPTLIRLIVGLEKEMQRLELIFSNDQAADGMLSFVAGVTAGGVGVVTGAVSMMTHSAKSVLDHGVDCFGKIADRFVDTVGLATEKFGNTMLDMVRKQFDACFGPYFATLKHVRVQIENYWTCVKEWVMRMWAKLSIEVQALFDSTWWALALIVVGGLVFLTEKLLVSIGVLSHAGAITSLFITGFMAYLGWNLAQPKTEAENTLLSTVRALVHCVLERCMPGQPGDQDANAPSTLEFPLRVLETLGTGLISAPLGTLQWAGRYGQALDQIRKGKDAMKEFIGFCFDRVADAWDYMTGRKDSFFHEISSMTKVDVVTWIGKSQKLILEAQTVAVTDPVLMDTVTHLLYQGQVLLTTLAGAKRTTSLDYGRVVSSLVAELSKVRAQCARAGIFEGRRCEPFWVYIYGSSHCGKSLFMEDVTRRLLKENGHAPNDIYAKNARDSFWSGYLRQAAVQIDDLSACTTEPSVESEFMQLVGSKDYKLNMAAVEDKGMSFNSALIITTSNVFTAPTEAKILDKNAYNNRRGAVIQCRRAQDVEFDARNPTASCEARLVNIRDETPLGDWVNCSRVLEQVCELSRVHRDKELTLMCNYRERNDTLHPIHNGAKNFLKQCTASLALSHLVCDDIVYDINKVEGTAVVSDTKVNPGQEYMCLLIIDNFKFAISQMAVSGMLNTFLYAMVEGPCSVESVDRLGPGSTDQQRCFFRELPLLERVYLRMVQKRLQSFKDLPDLAFHIHIKDMIIRGLAAGYKNVCDNGGKLLTIVAALVLIFIFYTTFFTLFKTFIGGDLAGIASLTTIGALSANAGSVSSVYSSSEGSKSMYSTRNIPIQYRNIGSSNLLANSNDNKDEFLMSLLVWLEIPGGGLISCIRGKGRFIYLTKHQAEAIPDGARVEAVTRLKDGTARGVRFIWDATKIQNYSGTEAVTYHDAVFTPLPEPHKGAFEVDIDGLPTLFDINVVVVKRKSALRQVDPSLQALSAEQPIIDRWASNAKLCREMQGFNTFAYGGTYRNEIPISILSKCPTYAEDCGAILTTMWKGQRRVIGMHVASGFKKGVSKDWTSTATLLPTLTDLTCDSGLSIVEESGVSYPGYRKLGYIPKIQDRPYCAGRTMFVPVPDNLKFVPENLVERFEDGTEQKVVVEIKQPAILTAKDPRIPEGIIYDPLKNGMEKFKQPMDLLDDKLCAEIVQDISDGWHDCMENLEDTSDEVAINGAEDEFFDKFNMQTSEGYPWVKQRGIGESGKLRYFEDNGDGVLSLRKETQVWTAYHQLQEYSKCAIPELVCIETPKDECLPLRKITVKPKTRLFSILPLEFNLFLRKKFLAFAASLQQNRDKLPTQVGVDPYSREWGAIYSRLRSKNSVAINCDYAQFDGLITAQILKHIGNAINNVYAGDTVSKMQRHNMLMAIVNRKSICDSQVYEVSAGIPSGCALTVLLNSIFNEILIRYVWKTTIIGIPREMFSTYVSLIVYGDDNLIAVHPEFLCRFNGMIIQHKLKEIGVTITDGSDKTATGLYEKPFGRLDFLKRRFAKQSDGTVLAPLDLASIYTSLQNVTLGAGSIPAAVKQNVHSALTELYLHQNPQWFNDLRSFYVKKQNWTDLPTWNQCHAFHREHMTGVLPWAPHRMMDIPVDMPKLKQAMANQGEADYSCQVAERVFVCGPRFNASQVAKHFVVSHTGSLKRGETGVMRPVDFNAEGQGRLPTQLWVKQFRSSSHHITSLIRNAYGEGCSIYFRSEPPYIANWLSATSFAMGLGMDYKAILNHYHNVCTPDATCLDPYFVMDRFKRVDKYAPPHVRDRCSWRGDKL